MEHTSWAGLGWTMQERTMSRRNVVFTGEQVYWRRREAIYCEESHSKNDFITVNRFHDGAMEPTILRSFRNFYEPEDAQLRLWKTSQQLVTSYARRTSVETVDFGVKESKRRGSVGSVASIVVP